jgi:hypothetical protein
LRDTFAGSRFGIAVTKDELMAGDEDPTPRIFGRDVGAVVIE